jgi:glycosyltransferase involved in cell wall biosynthesis
MQPMSRPLRIAQLVHNFLIGGGEVQLAALATGLSKGHQVHVGALEKVGPLLASVRAHGIEPEEFRLGRSLAHPKTLIEVRRIARWLRRIGADVLHAHDFYTELLAVPAARLAGCKVVVGRLDLVHWHGKVRHALLAGVTRLADHAVANAEAVRRLLRTEGVPDERITVIRNGIDLAAFDARAARTPDAALPAGGPVAVLVANLRHEVKRQEDFLEALALARAQAPELQGWLVGEGQRRDFLVLRAKALGLEGAAHFLGRRMDVPALLRRATLGVLCSNREGLSNAIIEGMAASLPMVVTEVGGNPELVRDGASGFVVPPQDPPALARAMLRVLADGARARQMGAEGRSFVTRELTLDAMVGAHEALYRKLVAPAGAGAASLAL